MSTVHRVISLQNARDRAQDPEFKLMWEQKRLELIGQAERGEIGLWASTKTE